MIFIGSNNLIPFFKIILTLSNFMRKIKKIHNPHYAPIADLITYSALPSRELEQIDPFLFLNHHGPQVYPPNNNGPPFGPHPHRGMETVTFILSGDVEQVVCSTCLQEKD